MVMPVQAFVKRQKVALDDDQIDRISSLPDELLAHILSFLPTKDAVKTVLIRRFGNLWTSIHNLDFDECLYHKCNGVFYYEDRRVNEERLINLIRHLLILHERSDIHRFCLKLQLNQLKLANEIDTWIRFAMRKKVKVLDLDFKACGYAYDSPGGYHKLPNVVLTSDILTELKLAYCRVEPGEHIRLRSLKNLSLEDVLISDKTMIEIIYGSPALESLFLYRYYGFHKLDFSSCVEPREHIQFPSLKSLSLKDMLISDKTMIELISGCPTLESLFLFECYGFHRLDFTSLNLKNVVIELNWKDSSRLEVSCPYMTSLNIIGIERTDLYNVSPVVDAALEFDDAYFNCARGEYREVKLRFEQLHDCLFLYGCYGFHKLDFSSCVEPQEHIQFRSLKSLSLKDMLISDKTMIELISGCPALESLFLFECYGFHRLDFTSLNLKNVVIELNWKDSSRLEVSCPYVTSLNITGIERTDLYNVSSVVDAALEFDNYYFNCDRGEYREVKLLFEQLHDAVTLFTRSVLVFTIWELTKSSCPSMNWRCLVLKTMLTEWHFPGIASLLRNSPNLEMLDIHIMPGTNPFYHRDDQWLMHYEIDGENFWDLQQSTFHCLVSHLKTVRIHNFKIESCAVKLVHFLLRNACVLEKLVIETKWELYPYKEKLLCLPRASPQAVILFCEKCYS
ncbi:hypothetical protein RHGRI_017783 [Rhododendron griersonianum]|uniref:F-box domain-containing protein n=1 Tax=Rhododendron griersonianum TaxID=479676 RepID=A0AAV6HMB2_9ERIC|nr:hypothetical protein RHGRI_038857 [Rhododendron griersonianum]KAG5545417.1 hypothetical protein RHGRI_017783 [Rhododendron griersonianum]